MKVTVKSAITQVPLSEIAIGDCFVCGGVSGHRRKGIVVDKEGGLIMKVYSPDADPVYYVEPSRGELCWDKGTMMVTPMDGELVLKTKGGK